MKFYIVTPTFNALNWLLCCVRSVADQVAQGVEVHHHVQDGGSSDGTSEWLRSWQEEREGIEGYTFTYESGKDAGMYDALNRAWAKIPSDADVTAHLNSDEQYLPGALKGVAESFQKRLQADVLITGFIVVDEEGRYVCHRRPIHPVWWVSRVSCQIATCACFHKVETFMRHGIRFDTRFRSIADMVMYRAMVRAGLMFAELPELFVSTFTMTGANLAWTEATQRDHEIFNEEHPSSDSWFNRNVPYRYSGLRRRIMELFYQAPRTYSIYSGTSRDRVDLPILKPTVHWLSELPKAD